MPPGCLGSSWPISSAGSSSASAGAGRAGSASTSTRATRRPLGARRDPIRDRISAAVVERTYRVLAQAGVATIADAGERSWDELVELLDRGGHVRYDFRTASRLLALARAVAAEHGGRVASLREALRDRAELKAALDALPGCGGR